MKEKMSEKNLLLQVIAENTALRADVAKLTAVISILNDKVDTKQQPLELISQKEMGQRCNNKDYSAIHRDFQSGLFETPEGYTEPAYYPIGNQGAPLFNFPVALLYYKINYDNKSKILKK